MTIADLELDPEHLWLVLFGPGFGESIVVFVPGGHWIVVDSLRRLDDKMDINPALELLRNHSARLSLVALTHPHSDHAFGLTELLDLRLPNTPVGCVNAYLPHERRWHRHPDASIVKKRGAAFAALSRIDEIWKAEPLSRWPLCASSEKSVGDAQIEVLFPSEIPPREPNDLNALSTPMLLHWRACRLLLGADLPNAGWKRIERNHKEHDELRLSHALKASHHGSGSAQHQLAIGAPPPTDRVCLLTPFNKGTKLPDYADGQGVHQLLKSHRRVGITNAPPTARGKETPRGDLHSRQTGFGSLQVRYEDLPASPRQGWIAVGFDENGCEVARRSGDAAGIVV